MWESLRRVFATFQRSTASSGQSAGQKQVERQLDQTLAQLKQEDFSGIRAKFAYLLRPFLSEFILRKGWNSVRTMAGPMVSTGTPTISEGWLFDSARVPIQFRRHKMDVKMQFTKSGSIVGLRLLPSSSRVSKLDRSQQWQKPSYHFPDSYAEVEISLGKSGNRVGGTLTLPNTKNECPCVVLLGGSGPCDRDSTLYAVKPFKDIALGLVGQGIASVRFDKVTHTHGKKIGKNPNFTLTDEYAEHALAAVEYARKHLQISSNKIFLIGHSLGAVVTPKISATASSIAGFVLMAAPAGKIYWAAVRQMQYLSRIETGSSSDEDSADTGLEELRRAAHVADSPDLSTTTPAKDLPFGIGPHYWLDYRTFDPIATTQETDKPVLILQGGRDYQVTIQDDFHKWQTAMESKDNVEMRLYENLDHVFMAGEGESRPSDYEKQRNVDVPIIEDLGRWIMKHSIRA